MKWIISNSSINKAFILYIVQKNAASNKQFRILLLDDKGIAGTWFL